MLFNGTDTGAPLKHALLSYNISHGLSIHIFEKIAETTTKIQEKEKSMIGKYRMRTDLAMENQEKFESKTREFWVVFSKYGEYNGKKPGCGIQNQINSGRKY